MRSDRILTNKELEMIKQTYKSRLIDGINCGLTARVITEAEFEVAEELKTQQQTKQKNDWHDDKSTLKITP